MESNEQKIAELSKLLANGTITTEEFASIIATLKGNNPASAPVAKSEKEVEYDEEMKNLFSVYKCPSTCKYQPFSECYEDGEYFKDLNGMSFFQTNDNSLFNAGWRVLHTSIDGSNLFGAMLRNEWQLFYDSSENLVLIVGDLAGKGDESDVKLFAPKKLRSSSTMKGQDSTQANLYHKYVKQQFGENAVYLPYSPELLRRKEVEAFDGPGFFAKSMGTIIVEYIATLVQTPTGWVDAEFVIDSKDSFNLIRFHDGNWLVSDSSSSDFGQKNDNAYAELGNAYKTILNNMLLTTHKGKKYPPFNPSMIHEEIVNAIEKTNADRSAFTSMFTFKERRRRDIKVRYIETKIVDSNALLFGSEEVRLVFSTFNPPKFLHAKCSHDIGNYEWAWKDEASD